MNSVTLHAHALATMQRSGAVLTTFTRRGAATSVGDGSVTFGADLTVPTYCVSDPTSGDVTAFQALSLVNASAKRLFGINVTLNAVVRAGDTCVWNSTPFRVQAVQAVDPLGSVIGFYVAMIA